MTMRQAVLCNGYNSFNLVTAHNHTHFKWV